MQESALKTAEEGAERYPSVHKTACGGLFRIAAGDTGPTLVSQLVMILLPSHSRKQWGQLGEILGGVQDPWSGSQPTLFEIAHWLGK